MNEKEKASPWESVRGTHPAPFLVVFKNARAQVEAQATSFVAKNFVGRLHASQLRAVFTSNSFLSPEVNRAEATGTAKRSSCSQ